MNTLGPLLAGFAVGQGSAFLSILYLIHSGEHTSAGNIGLAIGMLSLLQWIGDWGGIYIIPKLSSENKLEDSLTSLIATRVVLSLTLLITCGVSISFGLVSPQVASFSIICCICCLLWSINLTGAIDVKGEKLVTGLGSNLSYLLTACAAFLTTGSPFQIEYIALAYCSGVGLTLSIQYWHFHKHLIHCKGPSLSNARTIISEVLKLTATHSIGQVYSRGVLLIASSSLSSTSFATFVLAKQGYNALSQVAFFTRRIDFVKITTQKRSRGLLVSLINSTTIFGFLVFSVCTLTVITTDILSIDLTSFTSGSLIACAAASFFIWTASSSGAQWLVSKNKTGMVNVVLLITAFLSTTFMIYQGPDLTPVTIFGIEAAMLASQLCTYFVISKRA